MGQYQQWLHYRDVDRLLHAQLEELTEELAQLQEREQLLQQMLQPIQAQEQPAIEDAPSLLQANNEILHALAISLHGHTHNTNHTNHTEFSPSTNGMTETTAAQSAQQGEPTAAISQALFAQGSLPPTEEQFTLEFRRHQFISTNFQSRFGIATYPSYSSYASFRINDAARRYGSIH